MRAVLDAAVDALVIVDATDAIITFNGSAERMFGYAPHEAIGLNFNVLLPPETRAAASGLLARHRDVPARLTGASSEVLGCRRDGSRFPALLRASGTPAGGFIACCLRDLSVEKALREEILRSAALEQQRIGQELHDETQQQLTGLGLLAQSLVEELQALGCGKAEAARRLATGIAAANRHVRTLARGLVPVPIDAAALPAALAELARSTREAYGISCRLECPSSLELADAATATHLYRIAQEAVGNAVRHGKPGDVLVRVEGGANRVELRVEDDGSGIAPRRPGNGGVGLRLMESRCAALGGRLTVAARAGGGTVVACAVPRLGRT